MFLTLTLLPLILIPTVILTLTGILPTLPRSFGQAIGEETCVWFNAFNGRYDNRTYHNPTILVESDVISSF
jgi:hypothetical protein